jgi:HrpA-like RNA helicase
VNAALWQLKQLGAIDTAESTKLTILGRQMALLPLDPRFSKILLSAKNYGCLYVQLYRVSEENIYTFYSFLS